jgi:hypothetical protein
MRSLTLEGDRYLRKAGCSAAWLAADGYCNCELAVQDFGTFRYPADGRAHAAARRDVVTREIGGGGFAGKA